MITREALKNDLFRQIVSSKTYQAQRQGAEAYKYFYNKNKTVFQYEGATGIKIGYTTAAGRCLVASAEREGTELIAVVLNDPDWFEDAYRLLDYGFEAFRRVTVAKGRAAADFRRRHAGRAGCGPDRCGLRYYLSAAKGRGVGSRHHL